MPTLPKMCLNGEIVDYEDCKIHAFSGAVKYGAGVFEGIRGYWNDQAEELAIFRLPEHLERLRFGMRVMRYDEIFSVEHMADCLMRMVRANKVRGNVHIRMIAYIDSDDELVGCGPVGLVCGAVPRTPSPKLESGAHVAVSSYTRIADNALPPRVKCTANYVNNRAAEMEAKRNGYDGVLILTGSGKLSEGSGACFFMVRDGVLYTPDVASDILESITRATVIELAAKDLGLKVVERTIDRSEIYAASEAFWCGTGYEVMPVVSVDRLALGSGKPGAITRAVQQRYFDVAYARTRDHAEWRTLVSGDRRAAAE
ncbi:MAG: branched-chain-amino-acid transaminase [Proteobacteria bacterium]|nr:branched-chain-amino-acid transaminase [Pseudomonadota bacterium]MBI3495902.1 branched-chain-amino-acid transaminase [Pseudomonadota bacterium]